MDCPAWWGGHACDLPRGHDGHHRCGTEVDPCCQFDGWSIRYAVSGGTDLWLWDDWRPIVDARKAK